jgi:hypothetical protein
MNSALQTPAAQKSNSTGAPAHKLDEKSKQIIEELKRGSGIKRF